jgi:hypothetical protein
MLVLSRRIAVGRRLELSGWPRILARLLSAAGSIVFVPGCRTASRAAPAARAGLNDLAGVNVTARVSLMARSGTMVG